MANRVLIDQSGFKVSKPGFNVLTAPVQNLQFSSDFSQLAHYQTGELDCNWNESGFRTYSFNKTFPSPPIVHLQKVNSATSVVDSGSMGSIYWSWIDQWTDLGGTEHTANHTVNAYVTASAIMIQSINFSTRPEQVTPPSFRLRYTVMDYNL